MRPQILYGLHRQIIGGPSGQHSSFGLIEILPRDKLLFKKQLGSLVNFFRFSEVCGGFLDLGRVGHAFQIVGFSIDTQARARLLIQSSLLVERQLQFNSGHVDERLAALNAISDINEHIVDFSFDLGTDRHLF